MLTTLGGNYLADSTRKVQ